MDIEIYEVTGHVVEAKTGKGVSNLRIEAWDKDIKYNDFLGNTITDESGGFTISFDSTYFREYAPDIAPELFFKVFRGKTLLKSTENEVIKNAGVKEDVTITIEIPGVRPEGKDRITAAQALKAADFLQQSDFKGVYNQYKSKAGTSFSFVSDMVTNTIKNFDFKPVKTNTNEEIVGQDVSTVQRNLEQQNIQVNEVRTYNPKLDSASLSDLTSFPLKLQQGQKVNLYEDNGKIRYYSVVKANQAALAEKENSNLIHEESISKLQEELNATRQNAEEKDERINRLQQQMETLQQQHEELKGLMSSEKMTSLLQNIHKLDQINKGPVDGGSDSPK